MYQEIQYVRDDFSLLTSVAAEAYGPNFFSYITRNSSDFEMRQKYRIISAEGYPLHDSTSREPFNASYLLACLDVPFSPQKVKARISKAALLAKRNPT